MLVRIRFGRGPTIERKGRKNRRLALVGSALLSPGALIAAALGTWRLAADLKLAGDFAIARGLFSHWQVWMGAAALLQLCSRALWRYGRANDRAVT